MSKTIFITGAGSGLGRGTAIGLAKKGHHVIATTETTSQKTDLMREANDKNLSMEVFKLDITNEIDLDQINRYDFDVFLANAAINERGPLAEIPMERFRQIFEINVFATLKSVQHAAKQFAEKKRGKILFMSSIAGILGAPYGGPYAATKHAIEAMASSLAKELKPFNVQVGTINPGPFNTGFNDRAAEEQWKWFDPDTNFSDAEDMKEKEKGLNNQYDPKEMIDKMIDVIPQDHHNYRTAFPQETEDKMKEMQQERWEAEI
ncbi:SDR family oxidoreductase [Allobacillus sp. SKP2-8]|uniref:SDR family oxidoreductase n=1 Tax=unclassified Allobacillus TaxID=2628859 RepID=UPI0011827840|nr:SDR family oxidoreductase [Allobacillus sp. SKP2-8]TSJ68917.1 SDR family oxidoreductase [Allobacillus sp. SKP2-8]